MVCSVYRTSPRQRTMWSEKSLMPRRRKADVDGLVGSVECELLRDMEWGNAIKMTVAARADDEGLEH